MIIVYYDVGGSHSSVIAANIHINRLSEDKIPSKNDLLNLPTFDKLKKNQIGHLIYIGTDEYDNMVYTLACKNAMNVVIPAMTDLYNEMHKNENINNLLMVCTQPAVNLLMKIGGGSSRKLNMVAFGRPIVTNGSLKAFPQIAAIVKNTKNQIKVQFKKKH